MSHTLIASIVRILKPDGTTAGTGFIVTDDGLIATCCVGYLFHPFDLTRE